MNDARTLFAGTLPIQLVSVANQRQHWGPTSKRTKSHVGAGMLFARGCTVPGLVKAVRITRIAPRSLDTDNLAMSAKALRDGIAKGLGVSDSVKGGIDWQYGQTRGKPKEYAVRIELMDGEK